LLRWYFCGDKGVFGLNCSSGGAYGTMALCLSAGDEHTAALEAVFIVEGDVA